MRLFIAMLPPEGLRDALVAIRDDLGRLAGRLGIRAFTLTATPRLHLTLKFLGEVPPEQFQTLVAILQRVPAPPPMPLHAAALAFFPPRLARVVAAELAGATESLTRLAGSLDAVCQEFGVPPERRPFAPHVTLARCRDGVAADVTLRMAHTVARRLPSNDFILDGPWLMESRAHADGATYTPLWRLRGA